MFRPTPWLLYPVQLKRPLVEALNIGAGEKLIPTLFACVAFEPSKRPKNFLEITQMLGRNIEPVNSMRIASSDPLTIFLAAQKSREKKQLNEALQTLKNGLIEFPDDLLLLNGKGNVYLAMGNIAAAKAAFIVAFGEMVKVNGKREGKPYIDPAMTLFRLLLDEKKFDQAYKVNASCYNWLGQDKEKYLTLYDSFAWLFIYKGAMAKAADNLANFLSRKALSANAAEWMVFALVAVDTKKEDLALSMTRVFAPNILKVFLGGEFMFSPATSFVIKLISSYSPDPDGGLNFKKATL